MLARSALFSLSDKGNNDTPVSARRTVACVRVPDRIFSSVRAGCKRIRTITPAFQASSG